MKNIDNDNSSIPNELKRAQRVEKKTKQVLDTKIERRGFLKMAAAAAAATLPAKEAPAFFDFFKKHYKEMTPAEKKVAIAKLE